VASPFTRKRYSYQQADNLPDDDQQALIQVLDGLMKKAQLSKVMGKAAKG